MTPHSIFRLYLYEILILIGVLANYCTEILRRGHLASEKEMQAVARRSI